MAAPSSALLPGLAFALAAGILAGDRGWLRSEIALALGAVALLVGPLIWRSARGRALLALAAMAAAGGLALSAKLEQARRDRIAAPFAANVEATVCRGAWGERWLQVDLCALANVDPSPSARRLPHRVRVGATRASEAGGWLAALARGERIRARLRLRPTRGLRNPGGRDGARALARDGVGGLARLDDPGLALHLPERDRAGGPIEGLRRSVEARRIAIGARLADAGPGASLVRALALGQRDALAERDRDAFGRLGLGHLLAVSGLHLALTAGFAYALLRLLLVRATPLAERLDPRRLALPAALVVAAGYAVLTGWGVPVRRALVLLCVIGAALGLGRRAAASHALAAGAIAILAFDPAALFSVGAQLSFVASAALLLGLRDPRGRDAQGLLAVPARYLVATLRTSATAIAVTAPLVASFGGRVGPLSLAANLVLVPWTALVLLPSSLLAAACAALAGGVPAPLAAATQAPVAVAEAIAAFTLGAVGRAAECLPPLAAGARPAEWALLLAACGALLVLRVHGTTARVLLAVAITLVLRLAPGASLWPAPPRLVAFDVGLGDAILVEGRRASVLVDAGRAHPDGVDLGRRAVLPGLRALGIERLDLLVASHGDLDHRGGIPSVLRSLPVGEVWLPPGGRNEPGCRALLEAASERDVPVRERGAGDAALSLDDLRVVPVWPPRAGWSGSRNDRSLVVRVETAGLGLLLTGDLGERAERALLDAGVDLRAEVLKVGHHGSRSATSDAFLRAVSPQLALVSASCASSALPHPETLARIRRAGAALWWTGRDGAVLVSLGDRLAASSWAPRRACE